MRQIASVHVLRRTIEVSDRSRNGPRESDADDERDQFDNSESNCHRTERDQNRRSYIAEIGEDAVIQDRWTSVYLNEGRNTTTTLPLRCREDGGKLKLWIKSILWNRHRTGFHGGNRLEVSVPSCFLVIESYRSLAFGLGSNRLHHIKSDLSQIGNSSEEKLLRDWHHHYDLQGSGGQFLLSQASDHESAVIRHHATQCMRRVCQISAWGIRIRNLNSLAVQPCSNSPFWEVCRRPCRRKRRELQGTW